MIVIGAIPGEAQALSDAVGDKLLHLGAYSFLTCALFGGMRGTTTSRALRSLIAIGVLGALDEAIQSFMPYRNANLSDWAFDMLAAGLALAVLILITGNKPGLYPVANHRATRPAEGSN